MKEIAIPMLEKIESLNAQVEQIKQDCKIRKSATRQSLANLYDLMRSEILASEVRTEKAAEEPIPVS